MAGTNKKKKKTRKKRAAKGTAAAKAPNPAFAFLIAFMKKRPKAVYADAAAAAAKAGHKIYPIMWGRAQVVLGRVASKPRGTGKTAVARKKAATRATPPKAAKRPVGRPRKNAAAASKGNSIPVAEGDLARMSGLVDALNGGGKAVLRYDGDGWELAVE